MADFDPLAEHFARQQEFREAHEPPDRLPGRSHEIADLEEGLRRGDGVTVRRDIPEPPQRPSCIVTGGDAREGRANVREVSP